ncbi:50S ribosome-binding GTPase [Solirubrobacter sp. CPCC 204708]|uniref:sulfate adenylyltransferase n=1 Tax=Solirubrobacter deserti TaxID=2282478 RepID=A0ABT4RTD6_9ACTN|nr:GTP-binding protein [Solirubrobacter deserti]MBE2316214.1 50S ribosome-binding GTPase [Solirubrobacter deserti]MDA0141840.1 GTP-binding protein [Solirubrobacter deserti]
MDLLRLATAGSVDDGKSTLIGRLLYDSKAVLADQLAHVEERSVDGLDLALLTDGLRAEREQGITIDVAYRSFATPRRRFILADCPGHAQYTRNMVTGASTADLALLLVDARQGLTEQSRRHAAIAALLEVEHVIVAVNKMDLVGYAEDVFDGIVRDVIELGAAIGLHKTDFIPISALKGDNVVERSAQMPWYDGPPLLERLETVPVEPPAVHGARLPVQLVLRGEGGTRWAAGRLAAGSLKAGDEVVVLPSGTRTRVAEVRDADGLAEVVDAPLSVSVRLEDEVDLARGELIAAADDAPSPTRELTATVCWLGDRPARPGDRFQLKHGTRSVPAKLDSVDGRIDFESLEWPGAEELRLNDIAHVKIRLGGEIAADAYARCHATGAFILVDESSLDTVAAGMVS